MKRNLFKINGKSVCIPFREVLDANKEYGIEKLTLQEIFDIAQHKDKTLVSTLIPAASAVLIMTCLVTLMSSSSESVYAYQQASDFNLLLSPTIPAMQLAPVENMFDWTMWAFTFGLGTELLCKLTRGKVRFL